MKDRTLYHLLMTSARSAQHIVDAATADRIEAISRTLVVERAARQPYHVSWTDTDGGRAIEIDSARFEFHLRGDVPSLVAKRRPNLDLRQSNWAEAHRVWGEVIGDDRLRHIEVTPSRTLPTPTRAALAPSLAGLPPALLAAAGALLAIRGDPPRSALAILFGAVAALVGHRLREAPLLTAVAVVAGAGLGYVVTLGSDVGVEALRAVTGGVALLVAVAELAPTRHDRRLGVARVALAAVASAAALSIAPPVFTAVALGLVAADIVALVVRGERARLAQYGATVVAVTVAGTILRATFDERPSLPGGADSAATLWAWLLGTVVVIAALRGATEGVRDRLAGSAAPAAAGIVGLIEHGAGAPILAMLATILVALLLRAAPIWFPHDRVVPRPPPPPLRPAAISVSIRPRG